MIVKLFINWSGNYAFEMIFLLLDHIYVNRLLWVTSLSGFWFDWKICW